ncbi:MAG: hypothetical protein RJA29_861 [Pseudomonadota bacterium]
MDAPVKGSAANSEKSKALQAALAQIEKQFGKGTIMRLGEGEVIEDIQVVSTGSLGLDVALGVGGLPRGRVVEIYGPESSGKTTLTLQVIAQMQQQGGTCAFVDAEHALDVQYAQKLSWTAWCARGRWIWSSSTRWPPSPPRLKSKAKWVTPCLVCKPA